MIRYDRKNKAASQKLRKNMTDQELILWSKLKRRQIKNTLFYRQKPIGRYIVDFCSTKENLVIELDGGGHYAEDAKIKDKERDFYLVSEGFKILRFTNTEINNSLDSVLKTIWDNIKSLPAQQAVCPLQKG